MSWLPCDSSPFKKNGAGLVYDSQIGLCYVLPKSKKLCFQLKVVGCTILFLIVKKVQLVPSAFCWPC